MSLPLLAIFGGTFDPVHLGHLSVAQQVSELLPLHSFRFMPCVPSHKHPAIASAPHRLAMLQLATANHKNFSIDTRELDAGVPSYSVDTLEKLRQEFPNHGLIFILGEDAFAEFTQWNDWQKILTLSNLLVVQRPEATGVVDEKLKPYLSQTIIELNESKAGKIYLCKDINTPNISSTAIRNNLKHNKDAASLLPPAVAEHIIKNQLY